MVIRENYRRVSISPLAFWNFHDITRCIFFWMYGSEDIIIAGYNYPKSIKILCLFNELYAKLLIFLF